MKKKKCHCTCVGVALLSAGILAACSSGSKSSSLQYQKILICL